LYCFEKNNLQKVWNSNNNNNKGDIAVDGNDDDDEGSLYYSYLLGEKWKIIVLDSYDLSCLSGSDLEREEAYAVLEKHNKNDVRGNADWTLGLKGVDRRWLPYNGGFGEKQLKWLEKQCKTKGKRF